MGGFSIGDLNIGGNSTFVIAEAGSNHNGDLDRALSLVEAAADAGADAVKFQTFRADSLYVEDSGEVEYLTDDRSIYKIVSEMEMPYEWIPTLHEHCDDNDVLFMSTPFDERSADELEPYVPAFKVASYTMTHHPFLRYLAGKDLPLVVSTGAHDLSEVAESVSVLRTAGGSEFALLQCVAAYPTPLDSINVRVVETLADEFGVPTGLSDHTADPVVAPSAAVALGASVVEKHFTMDKTLEGPDHQFALEPDELERMVGAIRATESVLGSGRKEVLDVEAELHAVARRAVHATAHIERGERLTKQNIAVLRSGRQERGLAPKHFEDLVGRKATRTIHKSEGITWDDVDE